MGRTILGVSGRRPMSRCQGSPVGVRATQGPPTATWVLPSSFLELSHKEEDDDGAQTGLGDSKTEG